MHRGSLALLWTLFLPMSALALDVGARAPAFALPDLDGAVVRSVVGRPSVVHFWATWCGPCLAELPLLDALQRDVGSGATLLTINVDTSDARPRLLARKLGLGLPVLRDDGAVAAAWAPTTLPATYVVGPDGVVAEVYEGALDAAGLEAIRHALGRLAATPDPPATACAGE